MNTTPAPDGANDEDSGHIFPRLVESMRQMDEMVRGYVVVCERCGELCANGPTPCPVHLPVHVDLILEIEQIGKRCLDSGKCHHGCTVACARRTTLGCVPLSIAGSYLNDDWTLKTAPTSAPVGVEGLMQLAREWCLSWGEWAHDNDPDCKKETAAEAALRTALTAALAQQPSVAHVGVEGLAGAQGFLDWNRRQPEPPVKIGQEYSVWLAFAEAAGLGSYLAQQPAAVDEARDLIKELRAILENINQDDYGDSHISTSGSGLALIDEYLAGQQPPHPAPGGDVSGGPLE